MNVKFYLFNALHGISLTYEYRRFDTKYPVGHGLCDIPITHYVLAFPSEGKVTVKNFMLPARQVSELIDERQHCSLSDGIAEFSKCQCENLKGSTVSGGGSRIF